jgi:hypothetical protein
MARGPAEVGRYSAQPRTANHAMSTPAQPPARYRIRTHGHLDPVWSTWFDGLLLVERLTFDQGDAPWSSCSSC